MIGRGIAAGVLPFRSPSDVARAIPTAIAHIRTGGIVAHPTETVYGMGGRIDPEGAEALAQLKPRGADKPFIVLIAGLAMLRQVGSGMHLSGAAAALADRHWPGPLTLVLPASAAAVPDRLRGPAAPDGRGAGVAVRWTSHPGLQQLLLAYGAPLTSTSANPPGVPPALAVQEIAETWHDAIARGALCVLDGGALPPSLASTVVDCTGTRPRILRPGAIAAAALRSTVPELIGAE
jgi:L-threonylcarbamoyladenylate synthase